MTKIKNTDNTEFQQEKKKKTWNLEILLMGMQKGTAILETVWQFPIKLKIHLPYDTGKWVFTWSKDQQTYSKYLKLCRPHMSLLHILLLLLVFTKVYKCKSHPWLTEPYRNKSKMWPMGHSSFTPILDKGELT